MCHNTGELICIKQLAHGYKEADIQAMESEVALLKNLHHPNIVQVRGSGFQRFLVRYPCQSLAAQMRDAGQPLRHYERYFLRVLHTVFPLILFCVKVYYFYRGLNVLTEINHLEQRSLDQAQAQTRTPPFLGVARIAYPKA